MLFDNVTARRCSEFAKNPGAIVPEMALLCCMTTAFSMKRVIKKVDQKQSLKTAGGEHVRWHCPSYSTTLQTRFSAEMLQPCVGNGPERAHAQSHSVSTFQSPLSVKLTLAGEDLQRVSTGSLMRDPSPGTSDVFMRTCSSPQRVARDTSLGFSYMENSASSDQLPN